LAAEIHGESTFTDGALGRVLTRLVALAPRTRGVAAALDGSTDDVATRELHVARVDANGCRRALETALAAGGAAAPLLPLSPAPGERNRAVEVHLDATRLPPGAAALSTSLGVAGQHALRVVLCDGAAPLAWLALFRDTAFDVRERELLGWLATPLRTRLLIERDMADASLTAAALHTLLEAIGAAAFVLDAATGRVERLNATGRALLARDPLAREELRACAGGGASARFVARRFFAAGGADHVLAVAVKGDAGVAARLDAASTRWSLTPRQREVLSRVAAGHANKTIAAELACAESTVEIHVSALLAKSSCESRAHLVARFWSETPAAAGRSAPLPS
jgi:DNA-binding NarL/FixJ family response regulator